MNDDLFSKLFVFVPPEKTEEFKQKYINNAEEESSDSSADNEESSEEKN